MDLVKSKKLISTAAADYLKDDPVMWERFVMALTVSLARDEKLRPVSPIGWSSDDAQLLLLESTLELLMDPLIAYAISQCRKESDARDSIVDSLCQKFDDLRISDDEWDKEWGPIVDLTVGRYSDEHWDIRTGDVPEESSSEDFGSSSSGIHSFQPYIVRYQLDQIRELVEKSFALATKSKSIPSESRLIRLDVVNIALYKALLEHPELLKVLDWRVFEELLADILKSLGFTIELQRGTKDRGIDLFAIKKDDILGAHGYLLQAKRYKHKVGVEPVRQLLFLHSHYRATKSCLATTAEFTRGAWQLASQYPWQLDRNQV